MRISNFDPLSKFVCVRRYTGVSSSIPDTNTEYGEECYLEGNCKRKSKKTSGEERGSRKFLVDKEREYR